MLKASSFTEKLFRKGLYPYNWHFNMIRFAKVLEGMGKVVLAAHFKSRLEETGNP